MLNYSLCTVGVSAAERGEDDLAAASHVLLSIIEHFILGAVRLPSGTKFTEKNGRKEGSIFKH